MILNTTMRTEEEFLMVQFQTIWMSGKDIAVKIDIIIHVVSVFRRYFSLSVCQLDYFCSPVIGVLVSGRESINGALHLRSALGCIN